MVFRNLKLFTSTGEEAGETPTQPGAIESPAFFTWGRNRMYCRNTVFRLEFQTVDIIQKANKS